MSEGDEIFMAILPKGDPRLRNWNEMFMGSRVPVVNDEAQRTRLPDGVIQDCYFVDFDEAGEELRQHLFVVNKHRGNRPEVAAMLGSRIYPLRAENLTVVRSRRGFWMK